MGTAETQLVPKWRIQGRRPPSIQVSTTPEMPGVVFDSSLPLASQSTVIHWILDLFNPYPVLWPLFWSSPLPQCLVGHLVCSVGWGAQVWERDWSKGTMRILFLKCKPERVNVFITFPSDKVQEFTTCADLASIYLYRPISFYCPPPYSALQQRSTFSPPTHSPHLWPFAHADFSRWTSLLAFSPNSWLPLSFLYIVSIL